MVHHGDVARFIDVLPEFTLACLVVAMLPGPATALFLHRTIRDGRRCGLAAVAGNLGMAQRSQGRIRAG